MQKEMPELSAYFQTGGLVDAILNQGLPAPIDVQVSSNDLKEAYQMAAHIRSQVSRIPGVADTHIPEDVDAPSLQLSINRYYAQEMGLSEHEVVSNIITSLTSDGMISPSYWVDPKSGNLYMLTVQFPDNTVRSLEDFFEYYVTHGVSHDGWHRRFERHSDRGIYPSTDRGWCAASRGGAICSTRPASPDFDDVFGDGDRTHPDGSSLGSRQRILCSLGSRHHRRITGFGRSNRIHRTGRGPMGLPQPQTYRSAN
jgi:hypothetical protein